MPFSPLRSARDDEMTDFLVVFNDTLQSREPAVMIKPAFRVAQQCQLMCNVTVVEWLNVPLLPLMVSVAFVPEAAPLPTLTVNVEDPGLPAGFGLKLALV